MCVEDHTFRPSLRGKNRIRGSSQGNGFPSGDDAIKTGSNTLYKQTGLSREKTACSLRLLLESLTQDKGLLVCFSQAKKGKVCDSLSFY